MKSINKSQKMGSVKLARKHLNQLKELAETEGITQKDCMGKIIETMANLKKERTKLKAKLNIKEMERPEALALLERKIDSLEKICNYIVGMVKTQEREILNPVLNETRKIAGQNQEIIAAFKSIK